MPDPEQPQVPLCPHCKKPIIQVGWVVAPAEGAACFTFYHNDPDCMTALNCQLIQLQQTQRRVQLPSELQPRGLG